MTDMSAEPPVHPLIFPLTLAGALPFVGCAIAAWQLRPLSFDPVYVAVIYGAVILSFLGGIHWSTFLNRQAPKTWVIITSNLLALQGWLSVLLFKDSPAAVCIFLALGFLFALWVADGLCRQGFMPKPFFRLRQLITAIVVPCLLITATSQYFAVAAHSG